MNKLRLPLVTSYSKLLNGKNSGFGVSFHINWKLKHIIPGIKCERIRSEQLEEIGWDNKKETTWYETWLYYIEENDEVERIRKAYSNYDNLPAWNDDDDYDKAAYTKAYSEFDAVDKELSDAGFGLPFMGQSYGIGFDMANNDKYVGSFKSYLIERYMHLDEIASTLCKDKFKSEKITFEKLRELYIKACKLWIEKDKIMFKNWALKMQGFNLDEWEEENEEWINKY